MSDCLALMHFPKDYEMDRQKHKCSRRNMKCDPNAKETIQLEQTCLSQVAACLFLGAAACGFLWSWWSPHAEDFLLFCHVMLVRQNLRELELSHGGVAL